MGSFVGSRVHIVVLFFGIGIPQCTNSALLDPRVMSTAELHHTKHAHRPEVQKEADSRAHTRSHAREEHKRMTEAEEKPPGTSCKLDKGNPLRTARCLYTHKAHVSAVAWYKKGIAGNPMALHELGYHLSKGLGTREDPSDAARSFEAAAKAGLAPAMLNIGLCYRDGYGVRKDLKVALEWLMKAATDDGRVGAHAGACVSALLRRHPQNEDDKEV